MKLTIGSRGSRLARRQAETVRSRLLESQPDLEVEIHIVQTRGDIDQDTQISSGGSTGVFTKEIEEALLRDEVDLAVHSLKDLPTRLPEGLVLAAVPPREDPADALISGDGRPLEELPHGATVLTGSPRRRAQTLHARADLDVRPVRGNITTRLRKLDEGRGDALVLACAGLRRLGLDGRITQRLDPAVFVPAVGQAALALETRADDEETLAACERVNDRAARLAVAAERGYLSVLGAGCRVPAGALGRFHADSRTLELSAVLASLRGDRMMRENMSGRVDGTGEATELGRTLAERMLEGGGREILTQALDEIE